MTGANFLAYVLQVLKRTDKNTETYTAIADTVMDMRSRMLSDEFSYVTTTAAGLSIGDNKIAVPSDFGHLIGCPIVKDTASDSVYPPLRKISKSEYDELYFENLSTAVGSRITGVPVDFCYYGKEIYLGPAVDKTSYSFTINYTTEDAPAYTAVTASIPFTDQFREVVRAGTLQRIFREVGNYPESDVWGAVYSDGIMNIIANDDFNRDGSSQSLNYNGV